MIVNIRSCAQLLPRRGVGKTLAGPPTTCAGYGPSASALGWMGCRTRPPKMREQARLPGGGPKIGGFWACCKIERRCGRPPYDRLLTHPVLRADYHYHHSDTARRWPGPDRRFGRYGPSGLLWRGWRAGQSRRRRENR